mgnify:CR=1 FL=1
MRGPQLMTYKVSLQDNQRQFEVQEDETLLEAALYQEIGLPYGCQSGGCGACRARIVSGEVEYDYDPPALSEREKAEGYALLCQARPRSDLVIQVEELPDHHAIQVRNMPVRVERREQLCHDVMALWLRLPKGEAFEYLAGQYLDFLLRDGRRRSFSIANSPAEFRRTGLLELHLRHVPEGSFTAHVFNEMTDRAMLRMEAPLGGFYLREDNERPIVFMAGGTGFAPIKSMIEHALERKLDRPMHLYWGVRARRDLYMSDLAEQWQAKNPSLRFTPVLSEATEEDQWPGKRGLVHEAVAEDHPDMRDLDVYMSGPPVMIQAASKQFSSQGLPDGQLHYDSFDYAYQTWPDKEASTG